MSVNPMQEIFFSQNFAFSTNYLDKEIPDFRKRVAQAVPLHVMPNGIILNVKFQPLHEDTFRELIQSTLAEKNALVCNDALQFHRSALQQAGDNEEYRESIWRLADQHALCVPIHLFVVDTARSFARDARRIRFGTDDLCR